MTEEYRQHLRRQIQEVLVQAVGDQAFMRSMIGQAVRSALTGAVQAEVGAQISELFGPDRDSVPSV